MTRQTIVFLFLAFLMPFASCTNSPRQESVDEQNAPSDTTKSIKINSYWLTPKSSFKLVTHQTTNDTLNLVTCSEFVYFPFGKLKEKGELRTSLLNTFQIADRIDTMDNGVFEFQILKLNSNRMIIFFENDPESLIHSYIQKGEIYDGNVNFEENIKVGMSIEEFYRAFFDSFPKQLESNYNVINLISCVDDIRHTYTFENKKLKSVKFVKDSYWKIDY